MFLSRNLQYDYIAARRYDEAEAEYRRSLALEGSHVEPAWVAFLRMLAHKDADLKALRELHRPTGARLRQTAFRHISATSGPCCTTATPCSPSCAKPPQIPPTAATTRSGSWPTRWVTRTWLRPRCANPWKAGKGFKEGHMDYRQLLDAVACPLFRPSSPSRIQEAADRNRIGRLLAANRQVGRWLQAGRRRRFPVPVTGASAASAAQIRKQFGRDAGKPLTRMGPRRGSVAGSTGFGMGSVGRGGSVGPAETRSRSSAYSRRTGLSVVLKIRVSMVRFRPWPPLPTR